MHGGRHVLHRNRLRPALAAAVMLAAAMCCQHACAQHFPAPPQGIRVAEAGSIGGPIGKRDKTLSGEEQRSPAPDAGSARSTRPNRPESLPNAIHLNEHWHGMSWSVALHHSGGSNYEGTWNHGYVTKFTVTSFTGNSIKMERTDKPAFGACTGTYTGSRTGNRANGEASISSGASTTWEASW
jgi:hypothetical protein